jgi:phosphate transport system permease protein
MASIIVAGRKREFHRISDSFWQYAVYIFGASSFLILFLIALFIVREGYPAFVKIGIWQFISGTTWDMADNIYGILPMIIGTLYVTIGALIISVPLGIFTAIFLTDVAPIKLRSAMRPAIELLVGIPSVVYGLVGMLILVPIIQKFGQGSGDSILAASIVLAVMVLPTIVSITEDSILAVPRSYREGALSLGATRWQMIWHVLIPAARPGIIASIILGMGRAIGETMAMIMVIGNSIIIPDSIFSSARTLTGTLALELKYAAGLHWNALFATGVVLFVLILILNSIGLIMLHGRSK